ncbi:uncharacterized protein [Phyllobates terribilis]|uniref:uncharacterized protein n=1 Tax=Phyllobates terribilis TaxID=111132 RepID=UPI003CCACB39
MAGQLLYRQEFPPISKIIHRFLNIRLRNRAQRSTDTICSFFRPTQTTTTQKTTRRGGRRRRKYRLYQDHQIPSSTLVVNISSKTLSVAQTSVLQKGLTFSPTHKYNTFQLDMELQRFYRTLCLKTHFANNSPINISLDPSARITAQSLGLKPKSTYRPPRGTPAVETFISFIDNAFQDLKNNIDRGKLHHHNNLTPLDRQALHSLQEDKDLIIKPADKWGAIVIMDKCNYITEIFRQLQDESTYRKLPRDPTSQIQQEIASVLQRFLLAGIIDTKTCDFLTNKHPIIPIFYILPKIHKNLTKPPGRPIVASTDSVLAPLSIFLEKILTPLTQKSPSYLLDTGAFLNVLTEIHQIPSEALLVTFDVSSLYTSIPYVDGIRTVEAMLRDAQLDPAVIELSLDLLSLINFLDTLVIKDDQGLLKTDIYRKPTDRNTLLHFSSNHPESVKRAIPKSQFQRVKRIVTDTTLRDQRLREMSTKFQERGYPPQLLKQQQYPQI